MKTSQTVNEVAKALSLAQGAMKDAHKDKKNPFYKSVYADLASTWDACREPLAKNGLSVVQTVSPANDEHYMEMRLMHTSGQWIESRIRLLLSKKDMQGLGSAITYARRYLLQSLVGIAPADDDGNKAVEKADVKTGLPKAKETAQPAGVSEAEIVDSPKNVPEGVISPLEAKMVVSMAKSSNYTQPEMLAIIGKLGYKMVIDILKQDYDTIINGFKIPAEEFRAKNEEMIKNIWPEEQENDS